MTSPHIDEDNSNKKDGADESPEAKLTSPSPITFPPPSGIKIPHEAWKVLAILSSIATMVMYAETMLVPAIPNLIADFNITYSASSWILTTYLLTGAVMTPIAGKLSDIYGKKKILLVIMIFYAVGVSIAGFSTDISTMIFARGLQGLGISIFPIAFSIVRDQFPREKMAIGQGIITSMFAGGAVIGLSVGGFIIQQYGWQATFFTIIPIVITLMFVVWRFIHLDQRELEMSEQRSHEETEHTQSVDITDTPKRTKFNNNNNKKTTRSALDIKGAIALAVTITSFLLVLTYLQTGGNGDTVRGSINSSIIEISIFVAIGFISLVIFILTEKRSTSPLVDFKILLNRRILPAYLMIMIVGLSMFLVFQTIPILVSNPPPVGFGGDAIATTRVQLPFALVLLVFGPTSGFIVSKVGSVKSIIMGTVITAVGFFGLFLFHSTEFLISANLGIIAVGLSLEALGAQNTIVLNTPRQNSGISLGIASLLRIIGSSIGPALAAMYMQSNQYTVTNIVNNVQMQQSYPNASAYNLIFLTAAILSLVSIALAIVLRLSAAPKCQDQLPEERGRMDTTITQTIRKEILKWPGVTAEPNRFGGVEFLFNKKEMGHLHGERLADLPFPLEVRQKLVDSAHYLIIFIQNQAGSAIGLGMQMIYLR